MTAAQAGHAGATLEPVVLDLEHEPPGAVAGEEVLDGVEALAARAGRPNARAECDQGRAKVAALSVGCAGGGQIAAHRCALAHLAVSEVTSDPRERRIGRVDQGGDRHHRADHDAIAVDAKRVEARPVKHERASRGHPAGGDLGQQDRPTADDGDVRSVAVERRRLGGGGRKENVGCHAAILSRPRRSRRKRNAGVHYCVGQWRSRRSTSSTPPSQQRRISPTAVWPPRSTSRSPSRSRCSSKARQASARRRRRRRSRARSARR